MEVSTIVTTDVLKRPWLTSTLLGLTLLFFSACQTPPPTKVTERHLWDENAFLSLQTKSQKRQLIVTPETVVIDARPHFLYSLGHFPEAFSLQWSDFTKNSATGELAEGLDRLARRLARLGISKESPVIVLGRGTEGEGEEGRLAWTLFYLGVRDVQFGSTRALPSRLSRGDPPQRPNAPLWEPNYFEPIRLKRDEFQKILKESPPQTVILDVRSEREYQEDRSTDLGTLFHINIPWTHFLDEEGRPSMRISEELKNLAITQDHQIVVVSHRGVRSSLVTMVLVGLGYSKTTHLEGGLHMHRKAEK